MFKASKTEINLKLFQYISLSRWS